MFNKNYSNFVRAGSPEKCTRSIQIQQPLSGEEVRKMYLEEVNDVSTVSYNTDVNCARRKRKIYKQIHEEPPVTIKDLFLCVQNDNVNKIKCFLDKYPENINILDDYGWSLLMIACQANSVEITKELLKRGIDTSTRDKAGNSAQSLVIRNKNYVLADILIKHREPEDLSSSNTEKSKPHLLTEYMCDVCNKIFADEQEHLSSTIHNFNASKSKKVPAHYVIPVSNKGFQLMLKGGWDRESGLGRDGSGKKYPIKTVQKKDRKGLGHKVTKLREEIILEDNKKHNSRRKYAENLRKTKHFEINFRREFY